MIINGIEIGPIVPVRLTFRPSQAIAAYVGPTWFNEVVDACCPEAKGEGLDFVGCYVLTSDPEIPFEALLKAGVDFNIILWSFRLLDGPEADRMLRLFAAACAAEVLPFFEEARPGDGRPRANVQAAVDFARGAITREQLDVVEEAVNQAGMAANLLGSGCAARYAAWAAARTSARPVVEAAFLAARFAAEAAARRADAAAIERQREILLNLLEGEE